MEHKNIRVAIDVLGCKVNQAEAELLARRFTRAGYRVVSSDSRADVYILNTCTVTHTADRKSRHWFRMAHRRNPEAVLVAAGCYAERAPHDLSKLEGVNLVVPNNEKTNIIKLLEDSGLIKEIGGDNKAQTHAVPRTRTFIKIQDGCTNFCTYCIVPHVRRGEQSAPPDDITKELGERSAEGYQEAVITGVKIGAYNHDGMKLRSLIERILGETSISRLRLSSLQPQEITPELIGLWRNPRLCRHFHLSLQSGSDPVLRRMKRRYTTSRYEYTVSLIRAAVPGAAVTTDIIAGFPGETDQEFKESYDFCRRMEFARIHVFPYSPRRDTEAAQFPNQVSDKDKKERTDKLLALSDECVKSFSRRFLNETMPVLFEQKSGGFWAGLTDNYIKVYLQSDEDLTNKIADVKMVELMGEGMRGAREGI